VMASRKIIAPSFSPLFIFHKSCQEYNHIRMWKSSDYSLAQEYTLSYNYIKCL
jgi:hypothetical protein